MEEVGGILDLPVEANLVILLARVALVTHTQNMATMEEMQSRPPRARPNIINNDEPPMMKSAN